MYGELISHPVSTTKMGQAPTRQYRATPCIFINILAVYLVSSSCIADPSLTNEGSAMSLPSLGSAVGGVELPVTHPGARNKHHHRASAFMLTFDELGQLLAQP